jgi:hypothetical protein
MMNIDDIAMRFLYESLAVLNEQRRTLSNLVDSMDMRIQELTDVLDEEMNKWRETEAAMRDEERHAALCRLISPNDINLKDTDPSYRMD